MKSIFVYSLKIFNNFFSIYCIDILTKRTILYYKWNNREVGERNLISIIENSYLVGYKNKLYGDILLNYIWDYKEINTEELYNISSIIIESNSKEKPLYFNEDIWEHINLIVSSFDLSKITEEIDIDRNIDSRIILKGDIRTIVEENIEDTIKIMDVLNRFKRASIIKYKMNGLCWK
jgi:hypothetical protein